MRRRVWLLLSLWSLCSSLLSSSLSSLALSTTPENGLTVIHSTIACASAEIEGGNMAELTPTLLLHWRLVPESDSSTSLEMAVEYVGSAWLGVAFSPTGSMADSKAIIGVPQNPPKLYTLQSDASASDVETAIQPFDDASAAPFNLQGSVDYSDYKTLMIFTLNGLNQLQEPDADGLYTMLYAIGGDGNELGFHRHSEAFRINLNYCDKPSAPSTASSGNTTTTTTTTTTSTTSYDHKSLFAAHGFFATMSFAVIVPFAVSAAWFRVVMPKWWIYVHVLCNCVAFFFTLLAVVLAFSGVVMRQNSGNEQAKHMSLAHHWMGLILFILVSYQLYNGFRRPPVEPKLDNTTTTTANTSTMDPNMTFSSSSINGHGQYNNQDRPPRSYCFGCVKCQTPRERWHSLHRVIAVVVLILAVVQLSSGINLYANEYNGGNNASLVALWIWIAVLIISLTSVKLWLYAKDRRATKGSHMMRMMHHHHHHSSNSNNLMPQRPEDDGDNEEDYVPQAETRAFTNII